MWIEANIALKFLRQGRIQTALILVGVAIQTAKQLQTAVISQRYEGMVRQ